MSCGGFPASSVVKNLPANAGDTGSTLMREDPTCRRTTKPLHYIIESVLKSLGATATENHTVQSMLCNRRRPFNEKSLLARN